MLLPLACPSQALGVASVSGTAGFHVGTFAGASSLHVLLPQTAAKSADPSPDARSATKYSGVQSPQAPNLCWVVTLLPLLTLNGEK